MLGSLIFIGWAPQSSIQYKFCQVRCSLRFGFSFFTRGIDHSFSNGLGQSEAPIEVEGEVEDFGRDRLLGEHITQHRFAIGLAHDILGDGDISEMITLKCAIIIYQLTNMRE